MKIFEKEGEDGGIQVRGPLTDFVSNIRNFEKLLENFRNLTREMIQRFLPG